MFFKLFQKRLSKSEYNHVIITNFNLNCSKAFRNIPPMRHVDEEWLENRFSLFEKFCLPSIINQTNKNFLWMCALHKDTPEKYRAKFSEYQKLCPQIQIVYSDEILEYHKNLPDIIRQIIKAPKEYIVTSRLDSDDALGCDYIEKVQKNLYKKDNYFIDFLYGYLYDLKNNSLYFRKYKRNPFSTRVEKHDYFKTVRDCQHTEINKFGKVITIKTRKALWCQIVHGGNVLNKVKGKPVKNTKDFSSRYNFDTGKK